jgi:4-amino-4-deoxy-L-arabinose transferase-like glycosyltransferase
MPTETLPSSPSAYSSQPSSRHNLFISLIVLIWAVIYIGTLFQPPLMDDADTVHAEAAREMVEHNDWVTLRINDGFRYLEKAPLMYWCVAASFKVFGVHDWSARLPIALGVLALLLVVYRIGRRFYGDEGGLYAALAMATGFGPFIFTRILIPDMLVGLWLALGFDFFLTSLEQTSLEQTSGEQTSGGQAEAGKKPSPWLCWGIAATMALNILTKGLIGLVFPIGAIFLFLLCTGNLRHLLKLRLVSSFLVFLLIAAPWHLLAGFRNPAQGQTKGFFWFYFVNEHFLRYLNKRYPADYDTVPIWLFWGLNLLWLMPWTAFIVQALATVPRRIRQWRGGLSKQERATLLFAVWALVIMAFFSFSSRQEYYVIPALPGLALLLGGWLARETASPLDSPERRSGRISSLVLMVIGMAACIACVILAWQSKTPPLNYDIAELLKKNPQEYALSFGHFLDLTPQAMGAFKMPLLITGIALALGTLLNWLLRRSNRTFPANLALTAMAVTLLLAAHRGLVIFSPVLTSQTLANAIEHAWKPGDVIEANGDYEAASSVNFYTRRQMRLVNGRHNNIWYGSTFPDAAQIFDDDPSFEKLWRSHQRVFFWTEEDSVPSYVKDAGFCRLAKWGGKLVLTNGPKPCPDQALPR